MSWISSEKPSTGRIDGLRLRLRFIYSWKKKKSGFSSIFRSYHLLHALHKIKLGREKRKKKKERFGLIGGVVQNSVNYNSFLRLKNIYILVYAIYHA